MTIERSGSARWEGGPKDGKGTLSTSSGALQKQPYGLAMRFEEAPGTNPEELIAAAHAGCFTMALSVVLAQSGLTASHLETTATVTLEKTGTGFAITAVHLALDGHVPGADAETFQQLADKAKNSCPVSKLLNANITLEAKLAA